MFTYNFETGRVIVALNKNCVYPHNYDNPVFDGIEAENIAVIFHSQGLRPQSLGNESMIGNIILISLKCKEKQTVINTIEKLMTNPCVVYAEPDYFMDTHIIPNDPYYRYLWGMERIDAPLAWNTTTGNPDVVVGVVDSGINYNHPDITENMLVNQQGIFGIDFNTNRYNPIDETGHGTHVAGTIGAVGNNDIGVTGVCWNVKMVSLKIGDGIFNLAAAIQAIDYANIGRIHILNSSWGSRVYSPTLKFVIDNYDGLIIASAGNDGSDNDIFPMYPASFNSNNIISVAATNQNGTLASFSNYGATSVDIAAPGTNILSTTLHNGYSYMDGTSMAAPHVAGAAALLKGYNPNLTTLEIKSIILSSVDRNSNLYGRLLTGGILNIDKMIRTVTY